MDLTHTFQARESVGDPIAADGVVSALKLSLLSHIIQDEMPGFWRHFSISVTCFLTDGHPRITKKRVNLRMETWFKV